MFTKYLFIFSLTILFCANQVDAQFFEAYGVKLGISSFQINAHRTIVTQRRMDLAYSDMNERFVAPTISFWTTIYRGMYWASDCELSYLSKGGKNTNKFTSYKNEDLTYITTVTYNYLQFVPIIRFFPNYEPINPYITFSLPINYEIGVQNNLSKQSEKWLLSYQIGIGSEFIFNNSSKYFFEVRYSIDTKNFHILKFRDDIPQSASDFNLEEKHEGYIFSFGIHL